MINSYNNNRYNYYTRENIINIINKYEIRIYKCNNTKELINYYNNYNILIAPIVDVPNLLAVAAFPVILIPHVPLAPPPVLVGA